MSFLEPLGLWGLLAVPVIVLLHLLRQRVQREPISSLRLWANLEKQVRGSRFRRLQWSWILFLQVLTVVLLTTALIRPQYPLLVRLDQSQRLVLVLDTSLSMGATDVLPSRLAQAQTRAAAQLALLGEDDTAVIISAGATAQRVVDSGQAGLAALAATMAALQPAGVGLDWPAALALAAAAVEPGQVNRIVIYTDGAFEFPEGFTDLNVPATVEWNLIGSQQPNQAVVELATRPGAAGAIQVFARIANFGDSSTRRAVSLLADGVVIDSHVLELGGSATAAEVWTLPSEVSNVEVRLAGGDVLAADDSAALGVAAGRPLDALLVADNPSVVERALRALPNLRLTTITPASYVDFEAHDLTIFRGWLPGAWPPGGVLVFEPPLNSPLLPVSAVAPVGLLLPTPTDPLLADVNLAHVRFGTLSLLQGGDWLVPVLADAAGQGLVWRGATGGTRLVVSAFVLSETNMLRRSAFPVLVANAVADVLPPPVPPSIRPGTAVALPSSRLYPTLTLTDPTGRTVAMGLDRPAVYTNTARPGLYVLVGQTGNGGTWRSGFGVNAGASVKSDLRSYAQPDFETSPGLAAPTGVRLELTDLWPIAVLLTIVVLFLEARLAWR